VGLFDEVANVVGQAEKLAHEHPDQVKAALAKAEEVADDKTGHKYSSQIAAGIQKASETLDGGDITPPASTPASTPAAPPAAQ